LAELLTEQGVIVRTAGRLIELDLPDDDVFDLVRDGATRLDVGLVRMERQRHRMAEMFETAAGGAHVHVG
jgi:ABC-2 type transport system ATP-binding protein